jgi:hypothetical protein
MIYGTPRVGCLRVEIPVANGRLLELLAHRFGASGCRVVLHGLVNQAAALARLCEPIEGADRGLRQHDVDAFCHSRLISE